MFRNTLLQVHVYAMNFIHIYCSSIFAEETNIRIRQKYSPALVTLRWQFCDFTLRQYIDNTGLLSRPYGVRFNLGQHLFFKDCASILIDRILNAWHTVQHLFATEAERYRWHGSGFWFNIVQHLSSNNCWLMSNRVPCSPIQFNIWSLTLVMAQPTGLKSRLAQWPQG